MKIINFTVLFLLCSAGLVTADDGMKQKFEKIQMKINQDTYLIFEEESLILCDNYSDEYLVEITPEINLYIRSKEVEIDNYQKDLLEDYYIAQHTLFNKRNTIGAKGVRIGLQSAELAVKAVGGAIELAASGFDEDVEEEFEEKMEREAEKIEYHAEGIEEDAEVAEEQIHKINRLEYKLRGEIDALDDFDLSVDEDKISFSSN